MTTPPSALAEDLRDDFSAGSLDAEKWVTSGTGSVAVTGGQLVLTTTEAQYSDAVITSAETYDLTGSYMSIELVSMSSNETLLFFYVTGGGNDLYIRVSAGGGYGTLNLYCNETLCTEMPDLSCTLPYFLRIREAAGTCYWDISQDGATWSNMWTQPTPGDLTAVQFKAQAVAMTGTAWSATLANYNVVPG